MPTPPRPRALAINNRHPALLAKKSAAPCVKEILLKGKTAFGCSNWRPEHGNCRFVIWKEIFGKRLTENNIHTLLQGKKTRPYVFKTPEGEKFKAALKMESTHDKTFAIQIRPVDIKGDKIQTQIPCLR